MWWMMAMALADEPELVKDRWVAGDTAYVALDHAAVRSGSDVETPSVAETRVGDALTVLAAPTDEPQAPWIAVKLANGVEGRIPAAELTRQRMEADLDGDGDAEILTFSVDPTGTAALYIRDPRATENDVITKIFEPRSDMGGVQTQIAIEVLPKESAGIPLVKVEWAGAPMCGGYTQTEWISWTKDGLQVATDAGSGADAPYYTETTVAFSPTKTAVRTTKSGGDDESGRETVLTEKLVLKNGVYSVSSKKTKVHKVAN